MNQKRFEKTLSILNSYSEEGEGINRIAYSDIENKALKYLVEQFKEEGLEIREDPAGNLIARREGTHSSMSAVAFGSHIDTVYEAGRYDGALGVVAGLELIRHLNEESILTEAPLEVIIFACEESARFGISTVGSKAMTGQLNTKELIHLTDKENISFKKAIEKRGLNIDEFVKAKRDYEELSCFVELHIEQGPRLEKENKDIGVVTSIAAPTRYQINISGVASHSGTTPMSYRKDAFLAASEISLGIEQYALQEERFNSVATVGECIVKPGAMNVVPGHVEMKVDIRGTEMVSINRIKNKMQKKVNEVKTQRGLDIEVNLISEEYPVEMGTELINEIKQQCIKNDLSYIEIPSGAGHDAMNMAKLCATAMIFIPSKDGLSHNPLEYSSIDQIMKGAVLLKDTVISLANKMVLEGASTNEK